MNKSPFLQFRDMVMGHYSTANWLRSFVMALWNGSDYKVGLSQLGSIDEAHINAAMAMLRQYREIGENDRAFMALAEDIRTRMEEERAAEERDLAYSGWLRDLRSFLTRQGRMGSEEIAQAVEDHFGWLEAEFDAGRSAESAGEALEARARETG
jgi:hypothetical protein